MNIQKKHKRDIQLMQTLRHNLIIRNYVKINKKYFV